MTTLTFNADVIMTGESTASQLPGRLFGPADAYRHILLAAELTRAFGPDGAVLKLTAHEMEEGGSPDNGIDFWNNDIGIRIGMHVAASGGGWRDVIRLAREAIVESFAGQTYDQIPEEWRIRLADEGIRLGYEQLRQQDTAVNNRGFPFAFVFGESFEEFAGQYNRDFGFRTSRAESIQLDGGNLTVNPIATTSPEFWQTHPKVNGEELSIEDSAFPNETWGAGAGFVYEPGNAAVDYYRSQYDTEPPVGFGGDPGAEQSEPRVRRRQKRLNATEEPIPPGSIGREQNAQTLLGQKGLKTNSWGPRKSLANSNPKGSPCSRPR